jgi:phage terminase large subunit
MQLTVTRQQAQTVSGLAVQNSPEWFVRKLLQGKPYAKQVEILNSVRDHRRTSVVGCNSSGKDWAAARAVLWWLHAHEPAKALILGPTHRQIDDIVFNEMRVAHRGAPAIDGYPLRGRVFDTARYHIDPENWARGIATNDEYNLQGFHSPNLLVVVTEAHAIPKNDFDAVLRLGPKRVLFAGNPFITQGPFYDSHHQSRARWHQIQISAFDTPNLNGGDIPGMVTAEDIADKREEWGEDSPLFIGSVKGDFPDNLDDSIVPLWAAVEAGQRQVESPEGPVVLGVDVARSGEDKTVVIRRQGNQARIVWRAHGSDTTKVVGWIHNYVLEVGDVDTVIVDGVGIGAGVVDGLKEIGLPSTRVVDFVGGAIARKPKRFMNAIGECWWAMRKWYLSEEVDTDDDGALIGQVSGRQFEIQSDRRIKLQSKKELPKSPDEADALAMTFGAEGRGVKVWV